MFNKMLHVGFSRLATICQALTAAGRKAIKQAMKTPFAITGTCIIG
jgi:hypothetical protein